MTYRYRGHSMSDPAKYRSKDEVSRMRQEHDPIDQVKKRLIDGGMADEARLKEIDKEIKDDRHRRRGFRAAEPGARSGGAVDRRLRRGLRNLNRCRLKC